ncbi:MULTISPECIES: class I SAM-dependent methyltransferase [unclassified Streptomyces]|uniref:class I SAM-dependent methyltransferase n=1 Tax=unclassified Streptomyces TaxID=2593676 RepID=UPI002DDA7FA0|nr:class I SAM-dependent methyltransferase [Streptomyces sp. NBC_01800]WSA72882.1 class I SAM-dependent methyltransferase [Streptomyces sp. NBC_01800]WSA81408.1 class I SAM-dependent methyltransferase [Streptomyces sp. NBC_01799]
MTVNRDPVSHNRIAWDRLVESDNEWTRPVSTEVIERARNGKWAVVLIGHQEVDRSWFPADMAGTEILCLASGGGQQGPIFAATGAKVTVLDNSPRQLAQDEHVAARENLAIRTVLGDMRDLSVFADESFDLVFNAVSSLFCPQLDPVWRECFRVLRPGGTLLTGFVNPDVFIFDDKALEGRGELVVKHAVPYSDLNMSEEERQETFGKDSAIEFSHTLTDQIGGQIAAGFVLAAFTEAPHQSSPTARYMPGYYATRAIKPSSFVTH